MIVILNAVKGLLFGYSLVPGPWSLPSKRHPRRKHQIMIVAVELRQRNLLDRAKRQPQPARLAARIMRQRNAPGQQPRRGPGSSSCRRWRRP